jgi:endonuclease-3
MKTPEQIEFIYDQLTATLSEYRERKPDAKIHARAYTSLIGVMLSAQSQDARTAVACDQLFALARTPQKMITLTQEQIIEAIRPAGLFQAKSKNILAASHMLLNEFGGIVPSTHAELMRLPGVGKKSADIVTRFVFQQPFIAVDTHVFRLLWRLGWTDTLDEGKSSVIVNDSTPDKYKRAAHMQLIVHAKTVCSSRSPGCDECVLASVCDKRDIAVPKSQLRQVVKERKMLLKERT